MSEEKKIKNIVPPILALITVIIVTVAPISSVLKVGTYCIAFGIILMGEAGSKYLCYLLFLAGITNVVSGIFFSGTRLVISLAFSTIVLTIGASIELFDLLK